MFLEQLYPGVNGAGELLIADTTKDVIAAPGAAFKLTIDKMFVSVLVSAAQSVTIQSSDGTVVLAKIGASPGIISYPVPLPGVGVDLPANNALRIVPAAAGPSVFVRASGVKKLA